MTHKKYVDSDYVHEDIFTSQRFKHKDYVFKLVQRNLNWKLIVFQDNFEKMCLHFVLQNDESAQNLFSKIFITYKRDPKKFLFNLRNLAHKNFVLPDETT